MQPPDLGAMTLTTLDSRPDDTADRRAGRGAPAPGTDSRAWGFATRAVHAGAVPDPVTGARAVPIYQTTSFVFHDAADAASLFALQKYGTIYSRIANPTVAAFEERIASLEGGIGAVATSSGQAAEFLTFAALAGAGDHIVAAAALYGGTFTQLDVTLRRFGVDTTFVAGADPADYAAAITDRTRCVYAEVVSNPSGQVADLEGLAAVAHAAGLPLVVDATMVTPWVCRPIEYGADIVLHSATKFIGGHGTTLGGVIVESGRFDWGNGKFPQMTEPVPSYNGLRWWDNFGEYGFLTKLRSEQLRDIGAALSPMSAFLLLQGVEALPQRMRAHLDNARGVAEWLDADPRISYVRWAGLPGNPFHGRALKYTPAGPGAVLSFGVRGGRAAGEAFIGAVRLCSHLANVGDSRTLVIHPGSTTHQQLTAEQLEDAGVPEDLIRISVGLEDLDDILWDLDQARTAAMTAGDGKPAAEPTTAPEPAQAGIGVGA
jgi:O-acetylhomoserine (thiol)-lyase